MRNKLVAISLLAASSMIATEAMAEVGFQFRVPFNITKSSTVTVPSGTGFLLSFDVDSATTVGVLNENWTYTDTKGGTAAAAYAITAVRMQKNISDVVNAGLDVGTTTQMTQAGGLLAGGTGTMVDVFGGAKLLSSKGGKISSYLNAELMYRIARTGVTTGNDPNLGGVQLSIAAGANF